MPFAPLHVHSFYSLSRATTKPRALARAAAGHGYGAVALTDYGNLGCAVDFTAAMKEVGIKPILGCEFSLCRDDPTLRVSSNGRPYSRCLVLARNLAGWKQLLLAVSRSASREYAFQGPRLSLESFRDFTAEGNLIAISGYMGSDVADSMFDNPKEAYRQHDNHEVEARMEGGGEGKRGRPIGLIEQYISVFGRDNVFLAAEIIDPGDIPATRLLAEAVRDLALRANVPCVATPNTHYLRSSSRDADDHRVMLCAGMKTTNKGINKGRAVREPDTTIETFFGRGGEKYHFPSTEEMLVHHRPEEVEQAGRIADMCEGYEITGPPRLPHFPCPDGMDADSYLRELCERGFRDKIDGRTLPYPTEHYRARLDMELGVIGGAGLSSYFLVVQDFINHGRSKGWILGPGRGSGAGCIISWLTGITGIDPLEYGLIFERFYNAGRNVPGRISLPDIDSDVPKCHREDVYSDLQDKYGPDKVAKIATFNSMQGRSALTAVMAVRDEPFDLVKRITKILPDKARISEELEEMRQRGEEPSVIGYCLDFLQDDLTEWVQVEEGDNGERRLTGVYAKYFERAMRLEGTKTHIGMHAAGVVIGAEPLAGVCPMKWDEKHKCNIAAMEYPALEAMSLCKIDVLAVVVLDKAQAVRSLVRTGRIAHA